MWWHFWCLILKLYRYEKNLFQFCCCWWPVSYVLHKEEANDSIQKPSKFASWTISDAFQAEAGFVGSYWKPTFNIALDKRRYYCVVNLYNQSGYYSSWQSNIAASVSENRQGRGCWFRNGWWWTHTQVLSQKGYYSMNVWMPGRYVTRFIYYILDIDRFLSNYYVKYRVWLGEGFKDVELSKSYAQEI